MINVFTLFNKNKGLKKWKINETKKTFGDIFKNVFLLFNKNKGLAIRQARQGDKTRRRGQKRHTPFRECPLCPASMWRFFVPFNFGDRR
jgi:hypothetical protein